jgi:putative ABC transport system permease protein
VLLGIALGAAVFTSVRLAVQATMDSYSRSMDLIAGRQRPDPVPSRRPGARYAGLGTDEASVRADCVAIIVRLCATGRPGNTLSADRHRSHSGSRPAHLDRPITRVKGAAVDWASMMTQPGTMIGAAGWVTRLTGVQGQPIELVHSSRTTRFKVLATLDPEGLALVEGGRIALCDIATFQEFTGLFGLADRIDLTLEGPVGSGSGSHAAPLLPAGVMVRSPSARSESGAA